MFSIVGQPICICVLLFTARFVLVFVFLGAVLFLVIVLSIVICIIFIITTVAVLTSDLLCNVTDLQHPFPRPFLRLPPFFAFHRFRVVLQLVLVPSVAILLALGLLLFHILIIYLLLIFLLVVFGFPVFLDCRTPFGPLSHHT
ncbi:hypothetical protein MTO96_050036 [Rhipicephalus appendiculatus]